LRVTRHKTRATTHILAVVITHILLWGALRSTPSVVGWAHVRRPEVLRSGLHAGPFHALNTGRWNNPWHSSRSAQLPPVTSATTTATATTTSATTTTATADQPQTPSSSGNNGSSYRHRRRSRSSSNTAETSTSALSASVVAVVGAVDPHVNSVRTVRTASINLGRIIRRAQEARRVAAQHSSPGFAVSGLLAPSFPLVVVSSRTKFCQILATLRWYNRFKD
jgi:hypothetical protein